MAYLGIFASFLEYLELVPIGNIPLRLLLCSQHSDFFFCHYLIINNSRCLTNELTIQM